MLDLGNESSGKVREGSDIKRNGNPHGNNDVNPEPVRELQITKRRKDVLKQAELVRKHRRTLRASERIDQEKIRKERDRTSTKPNRCEPDRRGRIIDKRRWR